MEINSTFFLSQIQQKADHTPRSFAQLDLAPPALDFVRLGSLSSLRSHGCLGLLPLVPDLTSVGSSVLARSPAWLGSLTLILDLAYLEFCTSTQSFARCDSGVSVLDFLHLDSPLFAQSMACIGLLTLALGLICTDLSLSAMDYIQFGPSPLLHSFA